MKRRSIIDRFIEKVSESESGCWIWNGECNNRDNGVFRLNGKATTAQRAAYIIFIREISKTQFVRQICREPRCCNPDHLYTEDKRGAINAPQKVRFMRLVEKNKEDGCWLWKGAEGYGGYGCFSVRENGRWRTRLAHRVSYVMFKGEIPDDIFVLHDCDVRACVNPEHLHLGSKSDNALEAMQRGRMPCKLSPEIVRTIRERVHKGDRQCDVADELGYSRQTICSVVNRKTWSHVP